MPFHGADVYRLIVNNNISHSFRCTFLTIELLLCFSTESKISFHLKDHLSKNAVINAIQAMPYRPGSSNMADGLQTLRTSMFNPANGDREASDIFLQVSILIGGSKWGVRDEPPPAPGPFFFYFIQLS